MIGRRPSVRRGSTALTALLALAGAALLAQEPYSVRAFLEPSAGLSASEPVRLVLQIEGTSNPRVVPPRLPRLGNLSVIGGPNTRTNVAWINGRTTATVELSYTLLPERAGTAEVPALEVVVDGRTYRTQPLRLDVAAARAGGRAPAAPGAPGSGGAAAPARSDSVRIEARLGSREVWVGEPVALDVTLVSPVRVTGFGWRKQPEFGSFWVETVPFDPDAEVQRVQIGGRPYLSYPVDRRVLVAPGPGRFTLEPYVAEVQVRAARDDAFDWFGFGRLETLLPRSDPLELHVRELPSQGRPDDFGGAVGSYTLEVQLDREEARVDDAVSLTATVRGSGNLRSAGPPHLALPSDVKVFDPQVKDSSVRVVGGRILSTKSWEWILVPLSAGELQLPELRFTFFDPESSSYRVAQAPEARLVVRRGERPSEPSTVAGGAIQVQRRELAFVKPLRGALREGGARAHERPLFRALLVLPALLVPLAIFAGRQRARLEQDRGLARSRRARSRARRRLRAARRDIAAHDAAKFHEQVGRALVEYLADRTDRSAGSLTYDVADELLAARGVEPDLRRRFRSCLETCDYVRFVPSAARAERRAEVLAEAEALIDALERAA